MLNKKTIVTALIFSLCSFPSYSQFYKWVDEDGKVHYSDKKPAADAVEMNVDHAVMPRPKLIGDVKPIYYDGKDPARWVVMTQPIYSPDQSSRQKYKVAHFYFGGDCATPTSISWPQLEDQYPEVIPQNNRYFKQIPDAFYDNGYQLAIVENQEIQRQLGATRGHRLVATIVDMKLDACVKKVKGHQHSQNLNDFNTRAFMTAQNWIQIEWMLYDNETQELIYENTTEGVSRAFEEQRNAIPVAMRESLSSAAKQLLSDSNFTALLQPPSSSGYTNSRKPATLVAAPKQSNIDAVDDRFSERYKQRTQFVGILTIANYLRVAATEHYALDGKWVTDISDIGLQLSELYSEDQVRSISLRRDGTIELDVSPTFGRNTTIWLIPTDGKRRASITWQCQTNVEVGNNIGNCKSF